VAGSSTPQRAPRGPSVRTGPCTSQKISCDALLGARPPLGAALLFRGRQHVAEIFGRALSSAMPSAVTVSSPLELQATARQLGTMRSTTPQFWLASNWSRFRAIDARLVNVHTIGFAGSGFLAIRELSQQGMYVQSAEPHNERGPRPTLPALAPPPRLLPSCVVRCRERPYIGAVRRGGSRIANDNTAMAVAR
jgi:hypothetical protein